MPEPFIIYRLYYEEIGLTEKWWKDFKIYRIRRKKIV